MSGAGRVRLCGHVKLSALNSAVIPELITGGWESGPALQALLPAGPDFSDPSNQNVRTKIIKKILSFELDQLPNLKTLSQNIMLQVIGLRPICFFFGGGGGTSVNLKPTKTK